MPDGNECLGKLDMREDVHHIFRETKKKHAMIFTATMSSECLGNLDMREDVHHIFSDTKKTHAMICTATMSADTHGICSSFMQDPMRSRWAKKLTLHGLLQYYGKLTSNEKNRTLNSIAIHLGWEHGGRITQHNQLNELQNRTMVTTVSSDGH